MQEAVKDVRGEAAFTLVEVMIAVTVIAVALAGLYSALFSSIRIDNSSQHDEMAMTAARGKMEEIRATAFSVISANYDNQPFDVEGLDLAANDPDGRIGMTEVNALSSSLLEVTVRLQWRGVRGTEMYELVSLISSTQ